MKTSNRWLIVALVLSIAPVQSLAAAPPASQPAADEHAFLRFDEDDNGGGRLQTALRTYKNDKGVTVHLVAAVHIADTGYFEQLNKTFAGYDVLLYEMVKPKDAPVPAPGEGRKSSSMVSMIQRTMKDALDLDFQLDAVDYTAKNFVHADLDAETFEKLQDERGESMLMLMLKQAIKQFNKMQEGGDAAAGDDEELGLMDILHALTSPNRSRDLKLLLARQFENMEAQAADLDGTVLLTERNKAAMTALKTSLDAGKKDIGVFYGAAHMKDLDARLKELGFKETDSEWRTAWDMTIKPKPRRHR